MKTSPSNSANGRRKRGSPGTPIPNRDDVRVSAQLELELDTLRDELSNLEQSREHYADLYDFAPVGYLTLDRQGCIHAVNLTGARLLGHRRQAVLGKPLLLFVAALDRRKFLSHLTRLRRGQKEVSTELQLGLRPPFLAVQLISVRLEATRLEATRLEATRLEATRAPAEFRSAIVDLTERRKVEAALRESEARFRLMADSAPVMIGITGPDKACTYVNQVWLEFTGRKLEQELGDGWTEAIHPDDRTQCLAAYDDAFTKREAFQMEFRLRRNDREYRWIIAHAIPRFAAPHEFLGYIGSCMDITDRRSAEAAMRSAEAQLRLVTDIAPVMLTRCSRDLCYQFVNQAYADFLGRTPQEIMGKPIQEILGAAAFQTNLPYMQKVLAGDRVEYETEFPYLPDHPRFIRVAYSPEWDARGNVTGWVAAISDITERKQEERRIQLRNDVTRELMEAASLPAVAPKILQILCEQTGWEVGALWQVSSSGEDTMECVDFWHGPNDPMPEFEAETRKRHFDCGAGVVGQVWSTGQILFMPSLAEEPNFLRAATAHQAGLGSGFCFPIKAGRQVLGAIECYSRRQRESDEGFLNVLPTVGDQLGQFLERIQGEAALRQGEERFRAILETSLDAIITVDSEDTITDWNPQAGEIFGWRSQEVIGRKLVDIAVPPRLRSAYERAMRNYLETGKNPLLDQRIELVALHRSGREFPVEVAITPLVLEDRLSYSAFVRDITARKQAEGILHRSRDELEQLVKDRTIKLSETLQALQASETRFRGFVESAPDAVVIANEKGRIVLVNALTERLFGYSRAELEGRRMEQLLPKRFRRRQQGQGGHYLNNLRGQSLDGDLELFGLRRDGTEFPLEISLSTLTTPKETLVCGAIRDITERRRAEKALRESEGRLTAIMEHTPALMFLKDTRGRYVHFNRQFAQTFHLELKQAIGKTDRELFPAAKNSIFSTNYSKVIRTRAPIQCEVITQHDDGPHTSIVTKFPLFNTAGKVYAVGGIVTDITERKRVEEALLEGKAHYLALFKEARSTQQEARRLSTLVLHAQEKERKRISRELHDDVGQALNLVSMSVAALKKKVGQGSPLEAQQLAEIQSMLEQTAETVHNYARELRPSMLDELGLIPALRSHLRNLSEQTGLNLQIRADSAAEELGSEEKLVLFRVVQESLNNVVKHAHASRVDLAVRKAARGILLSITDNGKSFHLKPNGSVQGQRLGLLGMKERVRLVDGRFLIVPRPGKGTKVLVTIPFKPGEVAVPPAPASQPDRLPAAKS